MAGLGTLINVAGIIAGGLIGLFPGRRFVSCGHRTRNYLVKKRRKLPPAFDNGAQTEYHKRGLTGRLSNLIKGVLSIMKVTKEFLYGLPKAELHLHLEGTLEPELKLRLAQKNHVDIGQSTIEEVKASYQFNDLTSLRFIIPR